MADAHLIGGPIRHQRAVLTLRVGVVAMVAMVVAACGGSSGDGTASAAPTYGTRPEPHQSAQPVFEIPLALESCAADAAVLAKAVVDAARAFWAGALEIPNLAVIYQPGPVRVRATPDEGRGGFVTSAVAFTWTSAVLASGVPAPCTPEEFAEAFVAGLPAPFIAEADGRGWFAGLGGSGDTAARLRFGIGVQAAGELARG